MYSINKNLNKFVFVGEICRIRNNPWNKERIQQWLRKSGGRLSRKERLLTKEFREILSVANFNIIEAYFVVSEGKELWDSIGKGAGTERARRLREILECFTPRFDKFWGQEETKLLKILEYLNSQSKKIGTVVSTICVLSGIEGGDAYLKQTPVHLVVSSDKKKDVIGWFSTMDNRTDFVLECSGVASSNLNFLSMVLLHELFHLILRTNSQIRDRIKSISDENKQILATLSRDMSTSLVLEELLVSSFIPEGYLGAKFFKKKIKSASFIKEKNGVVSFVSARQFSAYKLKEMASEYVGARKAIDDNYLFSIIEVIKNR